MMLSQLMQVQAHANRLANLRLHTAMAPLTREQLHAPRTSFFPSLIETLNHILAVDRYYVGVLHRDADVDAGFWDRFVADDTLAPLAEKQRLVDERLIAWCDRHTDDADFDQPVAMPRDGGRFQRDRAGFMLQHLFMHQTHHRGQVHAMLSGTTIAPPQLDEFIMPSEPHLRLREMAALGWSEEAVYGKRLPPAG